MKIKAKIPANSVELGMFITALDKPWIDVPLLFQRFEIKTERELLTIREYCKYVFIETEEQYWLANKARLTGIYPNKALPETTHFHHELPRAVNIYSRALKDLGSVFQTAKKNSTLDVPKCQVVVNHCISSIASNPNALFWLTYIKDVDNFTAEHSLRVSILAIALGHFIGLKRRDLELIGTGALLHDIGKSQLPSSILNKKGEWSGAEKRIMQRHASLGYDLLSKDPTINNVVKDIVLNHHQRVDGKGYPMQKPGSVISVYSRIVSIIDAYDTITSNTLYRAAKSPREAMKILFDERDKQFDKNLVEAFIKMIGIYPTGSYVKLSNGETAIVVANNTDNKLNPKVELLQTAQGQLRSRLIVDLSTKPLDENGMPYTIKSSLADGEVNIDMSRYIKETLAIQKTL